MRQLESISVRQFRASVLMTVAVGVVSLLAGAVAAGQPLVLGVLVLSLVIVGSVAYPQSWWPLLPLAVLAISPSIFVPEEQGGAANGDSVQKLVLIFGLGCLLVAFGNRFSTLGAAALSIVGLLLLLNVLDVGGMAETDMMTAARAAMGFGLPWLFLFVNWQTLGVARWLRFVATLPLWSILLGVILEFAGITTLFTVEESGVSRLQGASIPAHLAMLALLGLVAALCSVTRGQGGVGMSAYALCVANFAILVATGTRGPILVGLLVVGVFVVQVGLLDSTVPTRVRRIVGIFACVSLLALVIALPELIRRSTGNSYEGSFNSSGREQAWDFFFGLALESPITGRGLGFSTIAVQEYGPTRVQRGVFFAPHNEYIHMLVDGGVALLATAVLLVVALFVCAAVAQHGATRLIVIALGVGTAVYSYVDNTLSTPQYTVLLFITLAVLAGEKRKKDVSPGDDSCVPGETRRQADALSVVPAESRGG